MRHRQKPLSPRKMILTPGHSTDETLIAVQDTLPTISAGEIIPGVLQPGLINLGTLGVRNHGAIKYTITGGVEIIVAHVRYVVELGQND